MTPFPITIKSVIFVLNRVDYSDQSQMLPTSLFRMIGIMGVYQWKALRSGTEAAENKSNQVAVYCIKRAEVWVAARTQAGV